MQKIIYIIIVFAALLTSCSLARKSKSSEGFSGEESAAGNSIESVIRNNISNNNFYIQKAEVKIIQENISVRFSTAIKFKKPDSLLIAVRSRTGIEAGRAFITKDTLIIIDRINKKVLVGTPEVIGTKYGINASLIFLILGDIIVEEKDRTTSLECIKGEFRKEFEIRGKDVEYIIDCQRKKIKQAYFVGDSKSGNITIGLSDIISSDIIQYPGRIEINDDMNSLRIVIEIKRIESPWDGKIGFISGQGYKVVKIR